MGAVLERLVKNLTDRCPVFVADGNLRGEDLVATRMIAPPSAGVVGLTVNIFRKR
jgi:hypothetical protein